MDLAEVTFRLAAALPSTETYGLAAQIRRSAISVPANIAEGYGRESTAAYIQLLKIARGSLKELETHIILCRRVDLIDNASEDELLLRSEGVGKMLNALIGSLRARARGGSAS